MGIICTLETDYFDQFHPGAVTGNERDGYTVTSKVDGNTYRVGYANDFARWVIYAPGHGGDFMVQEDAGPLIGAATGAEWVHLMRDEVMPTQILDDDGGVIADVERVHEHRYELDMGWTSDPGRWVIQRAVFNPDDLSEYLALDEGDEVFKETVDGRECGWVIVCQTDDGTVVDAVWDAEVGGLPAMAFWLTDIIAATAFKYAMGGDEATDD